MRLLLIAFLIGITSCSSIPEGSRVMNAKIDKDKTLYSKKIMKKKKEINIDEYFTVYAHPQVVNKNILLKDAVFYVPVERKSKGWKQILKENQQ